MNKEFIVATGNAHKLKEIKSLKIAGCQFTSMSELGFNGDIEEYGTTLEENARIKADYIHEKFGKNVIADDSGLEVTALNGAPGVYSARYAGEGCTFEDNVKKLLSELGNRQDRSAMFRTVIHLILDGIHHQFEGVCNGSISKKAMGTNGFGYDPVFVPVGSDQSFAEMTLDEKNEFSHRAMALKRMEAFLQSTA